MDGRSDSRRAHRQRARRGERLRSLSEFDDRDRLPELDWKKIKRGGARGRARSRRGRRRKGRIARLRLAARVWISRFRADG